MDSSMGREPNALLSELRTQPDTAASTLLSQVQAWTSAPELEQLSQTCASLLEDKEARTLFLSHASPSAILKALGTLYEKPELHSSGEDSSVVGPILIFTQIVAQAALQDGTQVDVILPRQEYKALPAYLRASTMAMPLARFPVDQRDIIDNWITALLGSEGISDDLIRSSSPMLVLSITPTLFQQAIAAALANVVDIEALRGGLTYYLQDLLSYALPAALRYLLQEVSRCNATDKGQQLAGPHDTVFYADPALAAATARRRATCLDVLTVLLGAESCPNPARDLLAADVVSVLKHCQPATLTESSISLLATLQQHLGEA